VPWRGGGGGGRGGLKDGLSAGVKGPSGGSGVGACWVGVSVYIGGGGGGGGK
jgi:hypothetical protein